MALDLFQSGQPDDARRLFDSVLAENPDHPTALYLLGLLHFEMGDHPSALTAFRRLAEARPDRCEGPRGMGDVYSRLGDFARASSCYRDAMARDAADLESLLGLVRALTQNGQAQVALSAADGFAQSLDPVPASLICARAAALSATGQFDAAVAAFEAALALEGETVSALHGLAAALVQLSLFEQALVPAGALRRMDPTLSDAWHIEGEALGRLHRFDAACQSLSEAVRLRPDFEAARISLANVLVELGRLPEACDHLTQVISHHPRSAAAHANLSSIFYRLGQTASAKRHAELALDIDPTQRAARLNLASFLESEGLREAAFRHRQAAFAGGALVSERKGPATQEIIIISTAGAGNVPHRDLIPGTHFRRHYWYLAHETNIDPQTLPPHDLIFNGVGDADLAGDLTDRIRDVKKMSKAPFLNDPDNVMKTRRDRLPQLLSGISGAVTAPVFRFEAGFANALSLADRIPDAGLTYPVLIRQEGSHGGVGLKKVDGEPALAQFDLDPHWGGYVTQFHDYQSEDGWWRKYRVIFIDRRPFPYHLAISGHWLVHHESAGMQDDARRLEEELQFLHDPEAVLGSSAMRALEEIGRAMDLDYAGADFTRLADGRVLVFEANATMLVHFEDPAGPLSDKNIYVEKICRSFRSLATGE